MSEVPSGRIRPLNDRPLNPAGGYVIYWMTMFRRPFSNFALQRAVEQARRLQRPLVILETLICDYPHASDRLHRFILQGMVDNAYYFSGTAAHYYPQIEESPGEQERLLESLAASACLVVADDYPGFFLPQLLNSKAERLPVLMEGVDSNGLFPLDATQQVFPTAYAFRRFLQKTLPGHLFAMPVVEPLAGVELPQLTELPSAVQKNWPPTPSAVLADPQTLDQLPLDHRIKPVETQGGWKEAEFYLDRFLDERLTRYLERSEPELQLSSELSPFLHFGQISAHQIVQRLFEHEGWNFDRLSHETRGKKSGWWGLSEAAESFLDELVTWREVGFNAARHLPGYDRYSSLPDWAKKTLAEHRHDPRPQVYSFEQFEQARTDDPLWNAAQTQLVREGKLHNYLRMLWGKKILEWSPDAETALQTMLTLNDRYALDGRDPNSISGIFWCLGRYDRAWGPERPIFGKIRYMSSANTARKFSVKNYLKDYAPAAGG